MCPVCSWGLPLYVYEKYRLSVSLRGSAGTCDFLQRVMSHLTSGFISQCWDVSLEACPVVKLKNLSLITFITPRWQSGRKKKEPECRLWGRVLDIFTTGAKQQKWWKLPSAQFSVQTEQITGIKEGRSKPTDNWTVESVTSGRELLYI